MKYGQFARIAMWLLAVVLPGGLLVLAVWTSLRLLRTRTAVRPTATLPLPSQPAQS